MPERGIRIAPLSKFCTSRASDGCVGNLRTVCDFDRVRIRFGERAMSSKKLPAGWVDDVLHFWFEELRPQDWFNSSAQVDDKCRSRFGDDYAALKAEPPNPATADARTLLAAV